MALASVITFFLLFCSAIGSQGCDQFVAVGGNFTVPLGYKLKPVDSLKWRFNGNIIFYKRSVRLIVGKNDDINDDGSLKLTNLKKDQAGLYTPQVYDQNGKQHTMKSTNLCVLDPVKKPTVNITCLASEVVFTCSHDPQPDGINQHDVIQYKWFQDGEVIVDETKTSLTRSSAESRDMNFSCEVYNQASSEKSDSFTHGCASTSGLQGVAYGGSMWLLIGLLVLIILLILCCVLSSRRKEGRTMRRSASTEEEIRHQYMDIVLSNFNPMG